MGPAISNQSNITAKTGFRALLILLLTFVYIALLIGSNEENKKHYGYYKGKRDQKVKVFFSFPTSSFYPKDCL